MIMTKTPLRASFLGGGSDLPSFYRAEEGAVLTTAIGKYIYINVKKKFDDAIRLSYFVTETADSVQEIRHDIRPAFKRHRDGIFQCLCRRTVERTLPSSRPIAYTRGTGEQGVHDRTGHVEKAHRKARPVHSRLRRF